MNFEWYEIMKELKGFTETEIGLKNNFVPYN